MRNKKILGTHALHSPVTTSATWLAAGCAGNRVQQFCPQKDNRPSPAPPRPAIGEVPEQGRSKYRQTILFKPIAWSSKEFLRLRYEGENKAGRKEGYNQKRNPQQPPDFPTPDGGWLLPSSAQAVPQNMVLGHLRCRGHPLTIRPVLTGSGTGRDLQDRHLNLIDPESSIMGNPAASLLSGISSVLNQMGSDQSTSAYLLPTTLLLPATCRAALRWAGWA